MRFVDGILTFQSWFFRGRDRFAVSPTQSPTIRSTIHVRFHLRSLAGVNLEWFLVTLAYNCKRLHKLQVLHHLNIAARFPLLCNLRKLSPTGC